MDTKKLGPVSALERRDYRARYAARKWSRPTAATASAIWTLLEQDLPVRIDRLMPKRRRPEEDETSSIVAKQSLVVALDCALVSADQGRMLTFNRVFDALAKRWSVHFRNATRHGARTVYDMREDTVKAAWRDLLCAGIRIDTLWQLVTGAWSRRKTARNPLFLTSRLSGRGHARGCRVRQCSDKRALRAFDAIVDADSQYGRPHQRGRSVVFAEDRLPPRRLRQEVCAEHGFNVVELGEDSDRVLTHLEGTRVTFNVEVFRDDYDTLARYLDGSTWPCTRVQQREYRKLQAFVSGYRGIYQQTEGIPLETFPGDDFDESPRPLSGFRWIKSRFFRAANRRYHASDLWPEQASKDFRARWFGVETPVPQLEVPAFDSDDRPEIIDGEPSRRFVERDISSSQTQILAVFLGLGDLEALARSTNPKFKGYLASELWMRHSDTGDVLADGYRGADDPRLVEFVKTHWMRLMYGGKLPRIIRALGKEPAKYGPGWRTTCGLWAPGGMEEAEARASVFLGALPAWYDDLGTFLAACQHLAEVYDKVDQDAYRGVVFTDPFDGAVVRWNPAQRATKKLQFGPHKVEVRSPGRKVRDRFVSLPLSPAGECPVDRAKLGRLIAPCLVHMLDAYFSSLVIEGLHDAGVGDVVAVHDGWFVPAEVQPGPHGPVLDGRDVLDHAIESAGPTWLEGLAPVYNRLVEYLGEDPTFGPDVHRWRDQWRTRVDNLGWPRFSAD